MLPTTRAHQTASAAVVAPAEKSQITAAIRTIGAPAPGKAEGATAMARRSAVHNLESAAVADSHDRLGAGPQAQERPHASRYDLERSNIAGTAGGSTLAALIDQHRDPIGVDAVRKRNKVNGHATQQRDRRRRPPELADVSVLGESGTGDRATGARRVGAMSVEGTGGSAAIDRAIADEV